MEKHIGGATYPEKWVLLEIGNGYSIRVHKDRWIPNHPTNKVLYLANEETDGMLVADLLDSEPAMLEKRADHISVSY